MASFIDTLTNVFTGAPAKQSAQQNAQLWSQYQQTGLGDINRSTARSEQALGQAGDVWSDFGDTFSGRYAPAVDLYQNALGIRGAEGNAAAQQAFQASPGYNWARDQALQAVDRSGAARGMLLSGNTLQALQDRGSQVANQEYYNWLDRLGGFVQPEYQAGLATASGRAGAYGALPAVYNADVGRRIDLGGTATTGLAGANTAAANSELGGSANLWRLGLAAADLGAGIAGGFGKPKAPAPFAGYNMTGFPGA